MKNPIGRSGTVVLVVAALLAVGYPLSVGPVSFLFHYVDWGPNIAPSVDMMFRDLYSPLDNLPDPMGRWLAEWWNYGGDLGSRWGGWT